MAARVAILKKHDAPAKPETSEHSVEIGLSAAIVSVAGETPQVLVVRHKGTRDALPFGPFEPLRHRTLESGLRIWVKEQTYLAFDYAEQLYTFGDRGRHLVQSGEGPRVVSVGYLALTRATNELQAPGTAWGEWYSYFPWEDWRAAKPQLLDRVIIPALRKFVQGADDVKTKNSDKCVCGSHLDSTVCLGMRSGCSSATNCYTKQDWL